MELEQRRALAWISDDEPMEKTNFRANRATPRKVDQRIRSSRFALHDHRRWT